MRDRNIKKKYWKRPLVTGFFVLFFLGVFLVTQNVQAALLGNYNKAYSDTLDATEWNNLIKDFVNTDGGRINNFLGINAPTSSSYILNVGGSASFSNPIVVGTPVDDNHAATMGYVDSVLAGGTYWSPNGTNIFNNNTGNVGIGISNPTAKLYVNGTTITSGVVGQINSTYITSGQMLSLTHASSTFSGTGLYMNFQAGSGTSTANFIDLRNNNTSRFSVNYRGGINTAYSSDLDNNNLNNFTLTNGNTSAGSYSVMNINGLSNAIASNGTGGIDELFNNNMEGFMFNSGVNANISGLYVQLKRDNRSPVNNSASIRVRLYSDNAGQPGTYLGSSSYIPVIRIGTAYSNIYFSYDSTLTANTNYWVVLEKSSFNAADNVYVNTTSTGGTGWAEGDGTTWSVLPTSRPIFAIYPRSPRGVFANSASNAGVYGNSNFSMGVRGSSISGSGIFGNSTYGYGGEFSGGGLYNTMNLPSNAAFTNFTTLQRSGQRYFDLGYNTGFSGDAFYASLGSNVYTVYYLYNNGTTYTDYTNAARQAGGSAYPLLATSNDHFYFGRSSATTSYRNIYINLSNTPNLSGVVWEYGSGADVNGDCTWTSFVPTNDETNGLLRSGMITPGGFTLTQCKVNGINQYWMRVGASSVTTGANVSSSGFGFFSGYFARFYSSDLEKFRISNSGNTYASDPIYPGSTDPEDSIQASRYIYDLGSTPFAALGVNTGFYVAGNVGIATTTPSLKLVVNGGAGNVLSVAGGYISGLNSTPINSDQAVPLGYLQNNYVPLGSGAGGIGAGTSGQTLRHNGTSWVANSVLFNNGTNVGIGTTNPLAKLHILSGTSGDNTAIIRVTGSASSTVDFATIEFQNATADYMSKISAYKDGGSDESGLKFYTKKTGFSPTEVMRLNKAGNLGIGTTNPTNKLDVNGGVNIQKPAGNYALTINGNTAENNYIAVAVPAGGYNTGFYFQDNAGVRGIIAADSGKNLLFYGGGANEYMRIASGGNVGIGTTTPNVKLSINGGTGNALYLNGGQISGLNSTPVNTDQAVPLGYLQNNYVPIGSGAGGIGAGTSGQTLRHNGTSWVANSTLFNDGTNIGIGTSNPGAGNQLQSVFEVVPNGGATAFFRNYSNLTSANTRSGVIIGEGLNTGDMNMAMWTDGTNNIGYIQGITYGAGYGNVVLNANGGNVGIGITNPIGLLDVNGDVSYLAGSAIYPRRKAVATDWYTGKWISSSNSINNAVGSSGTGSFQIGFDISGTFTPNVKLAGGNSTSYINSGNVGIGITNPGANLNIYSTSSSRTLYVERDNSSNSLPVVDISDHAWSGSLTNPILRVSSDLGAGNTIYPLTVLKGGNVGIGTTTPALKLVVNGGTGDVLNVSGGQIAGLNSTPVNNDQAVPLGYLKSNYVPLGSGAGGIGSGTSGQTLRHNGTSWVANSTLYNNGTNVGIGTSSPLEKLHVYSATNAYARLESDINQASGFQLFENVSGVPYGFSLFYDGAATNNFLIQSKSSGALTTKVTIQRDTGNFGIGADPGNAKLYVGGSVGIGTTNPLSKLSILKGTATGQTPHSDTALLIDDTLDNGLTFLTSNNKRSEIIFGDTDSNLRGMLQYQHGATDYFTTTVAGSEIMRITGGNVGISTTTPALKLVVNGGTGDVLNVAGGYIAGLNSTPVNTDQAVPLGYLQNNYVPIGSGAGGIGAGTSGQTLRHNGTSWVANSTLFNDGTNIGIGTSNPGQTLELSKAAAGTLGPVLRFRNTGNAASDQAGIQFSTGTATNGTEGRASILFNVKTGGVGEILFNSGTTGYGSESMRISAGNIGIGTSNPLNILSVGNSGNVGSDLNGNSTLFIANTLNKNYTMSFYKSGATIGTESVLALGSQEAGGVAVPFASISSYIEDATAGAADGSFILKTRLNSSLTEKMRITSDGKVGIGTSTPSLKLSINGGTGNVLNIGGGYINGLNLTPINSDQAVPLGYLQANYSPSTSLLWSGTKNGNIWNGDWGAGNVGIGTTEPLARLEVVGDIISKGTSWSDRIINPANGVAVDVAYGNRIFVTVHDNGVISMSSTGKSWKQVRDPDGSGLSDITYGNGLFVVTSWSGAILTSSDGKNWNKIEPVHAFDSVAYGNNIFIAVAGDGIISKSVDGQNWEEVRGMDGTPYTSVVYGEGRFVAADYYGGIYSSIDGDNWSLERSQYISLVNDIAYGNGKFVAVGGDTTTISEDGVNWVDSQISHPFSYQPQITFGNGLFVVAGFGVPITTSVDGINWVDRYSAINDLVGVAYGNGVFVAVGHSGAITSGSPEVNLIANNNVYQGGMSIFGNVGIGLTNPGTKLDVNGYLRASAATISLLGGPGNVIVMADSEGNLFGTSSSAITGNYLPLGGGALTGNLNMGGNDIQNINKLSVNTIDPLYRIKGINYSTFASSIAGGVKEEYIGKATISKSLAYTIDFNDIKEGSDLWVWRKTVDFSEDNVEVLITPYGGFAQVYSIIEGNKITFKSDRPVKIHYRLAGKRLDWRKWPTKAFDQKEKPGFIID